MTIFAHKAKIFLMTSLVFIFSLTTVNCSKKGKNRNSGGNGQAETPEPEPEIPVEPEVPSVGEEVPPIDNESVTVLETKESVALKHLVFNATETTEDFRYLSEYILIVRASDTSCIKVKIRPTGGLEDKAESAENADDSKNCDISENEVAPTAKEEETPPEEEAAAEPTALHLNKRKNALPAATKRKRADLDIEYTPTLKQRTFALTATPSICSKRLFRMFADDPILVGDPQGIEKVITKTARLTVVSTGGKVRVWVDEEFANACRGGATAADFDRVAYGFVNRRFNLNFFDKLYLAHLSNLADATEANMDILESTYGPISDVDSSGTVDIFVSPEVNRKYFYNRETRFVDIFEVELIDRPKDLSYFNTATNPSSNEGEIIYMWAPDPGGIYQYLQFPSANSLSSNFAKGFAAAQVMNMINNNSHLILKKGEEEAEFIKQSLAFLASGYAAGIDYSKFSLAHYMTSWPQGLSLDSGPDKGILGEGYDFAFSDIYGLRAMFGWYLHTRLCGRDSVEPCAEIKSLIDTETIGIDNLEAVLGEPIADILEHFGSSVGVSLLDDPEAAIALWDAENPGTQKPLQLPDLQEVSTASPPQTIETVVTGTSIIADKTDRTVAGPFPSKKMLIFQPILPDEELSLKLAKNSVTYILLTGLIEATTDATAVLGPNLNVQIVPAGERDSSIRRIHKEKQSEQGHLDLRPVNLTQSVDPLHTYFEAPEYPSDLDYSVTLSREIWMLGSIDKYSVYGSEAIQDVGDEDSYNVNINPCDGLSGAALTACQGKSHHVLVQTYIRDLPKKLDPMLLTTSTSLSLFSGSSIWALVTDLDSEFVQDEDDDTQIGVFCQLENSGGTFVDPDSEMRRCANGGFTTADFQTEVCTPYADLGVCVNDRPEQAVTFDFFNRITSHGFEAPFDNFFYSSMGFPNYNIYTISFPEMPEFINARSFNSQEFQRQFLHFGYIDKLEHYVFNFYTLDSNATIPSGSFSVLDFEQISDLKSIRDNIIAGPTPASTPFIDMCMGFGFTESSCTNPGAPLDAEVIAWIADQNAIIVCRDNPNCPGLALTEASGAASAWFTPGTSFFLYMTAKDNFGAGNPITYDTFYKPVLPASMTGYCAGNPGGTPIKQCGVRESFMLSSSDLDIRRQFNIPSSKYNTEYCGDFISQNEVCADYLSYHYETADDRPAASWYSITLPTDRVRQMPWTDFLYTRSGEIVSKPQRIHSVMIDVPGNKESIIHVIIGGRQMSQGKYLARVRIYPD